MRKLVLTLLVFIMVLATMGTTTMAASSKGSYSGSSSKSYSSGSSSRPSGSGSYSGSTGSKAYSGSSGSKSYSSGGTSGSSTGTYSGSSGSKSYSGGTSGSSGSKTYSSGTKTPSSNVTGGYRSSYGSGYNNSYQKPSSGWGKFFGGMAAGALVTSMFHPFNHGGAGFFGGMTHPFGGSYAGNQNNGFSFWGFIFDLLILYIIYRVVRRFLRNRRNRQHTPAFQEMGAGYNHAPQPIYEPAPIRGVEQPVRMNFNEQDLVDAVCVFAGQRYNINPQSLVVELFFNPETGFSATASTRDNYNRFQLNEQDLTDAVAVFLEQQHHFDPHRLAIELFFEEGRGFSAVIDRT